ncbi:MAG: hypothetical protein JW836_07415 [Deltaproteobacteria bacterium]|nr:hypothetical protein [Deltaproteobacteria bacterium]
MRKYFVLLMVASAGLSLSGCIIGQYGTLRLPEKTDTVTVQFLQENWENYEIYYAGVHAGHPSAVLFDRKDDDRDFITERWFNTENKELLDDLIDSIQRQLPIGVFYPRLWRVLGPDGHLYGYIFTPWDHAVMRAVDEKRLFVNDLPMPPYLSITGDGSGSRGQ